MGPAVPAGDYPGFPEMIPGGFADNNTLGRARGAGEPDHVPGSRTPYIGKGNLMFHGIDTQSLLDPVVRRIATGSPDQKGLAGGGTGEAERWVTGPPEFIHQNRL